LRHDRPVRATQWGAVQARPVRARCLTLLTVVLGLACALVLPVAAQPITVRDGSGQAVTIAAPATRVAALISSSVDIIVALGAADRIAARTRYDTAAVVARAVNVGGGLDPSVETLLAARPDLFVAWKGLATSAVVNRMRAAGVPVYLVETKDTAALYATVRDLGALLGLSGEAARAVEALRSELRAVERATAKTPRLKTVYVISRSPVIISAATSFIAELISVAGADNPFTDVPGEFPSLSLEAFLARDPDVLIVGRRDDGRSQLTLLRETAGWRDLRAVRAGAVIEVDGEQWGRPTLRVGALTRALANELRRLRPVAPRRR
jgi:iron complex transport system substrate-binding protein